MNKMLRDALGSPIPQTLNDDGTYTALANGDASGVNFSRHKMLRDALGSPLPYQYFDVEQNKFVSGTLAGEGVKLNNTLSSVSTNEALTAAKGKELKDKVTTIEDELTNKASIEDIEGVRTEVTTKLIETRETKIAYDDLIPVVGFDFAPDFSFTLILRNIESVPKYGNSYVNYVNAEFSSDKMKNVVISRSWNVNSSDVFTSSYITNQGIIDVVNAIRAKGITVDTFRVYTTTVRATASFMTSYVNACKQDIDVAKSLGITNILFANEQPYMSRETSFASYYKEITDYAHAQNMKIGASCSYNELSQADPIYINDVDFVGINWYPSLSNRGLDTSLDHARDNLAQNYAKPFYDTVHRMATKYNLPVWITESGCTQHEFSLRTPANRTQDGTGTYPQNQYIYLSTVLEFIGAVKINGSNPIERFMYFSLMDYNDIYSPLNNPLAMNVITNTYKKNKELKITNKFEAPHYTVAFEGSSATLVRKVKTQTDHEILSSLDGKIILDKEFPVQNAKGLILGKSTFDVEANVITPLNPVTLEVGIPNLLTTDKLRLNNTSDADLTILSPTSMILQHEANLNRVRSAQFIVSGLTIGKTYKIHSAYHILEPVVYDRTPGVYIALYNGTTLVSSSFYGDVNSVETTFTAELETYIIHIYYNVAQGISQKIYFYDLKMYETDYGVPTINYSNNTLTTQDLHEYDMIDLKNKLLIQKSLPFVIDGANYSGTTAFSEKTSTLATFRVETPLQYDTFIISNIFYTSAVIAPNTVWKLGTNNTITHGNVYLRANGAKGHIYLTVSLASLDATTETTNAELLSKFLTYLSVNPLLIVTKAREDDVVKTALTFPDITINGLVGNRIKSNGRLMLNMEF